MILAIDVGNTNIVIGGYLEEELKFVSRISMIKTKMQDQYMIELKEIIKFYGFSPDMFQGAIISSVVPPLLPTLKKAITRLLGCEVLTVSPGTKTGLNIKIDNPAVLGADLVCGAVAVIEKRFPLPCIIIDLGTATKFSALDKYGNFIGVSIFPGISISLEALSANTAQLPYIDFSDTTIVIGKNSIDSMKSGIVFGTASMIDGMLLKFHEVLGEKAFVVATGGFASGMIPYCNGNILIEDNLILDGLYAIYQKNRK